MKVWVWPSFEMEYNRGVRFFAEDAQVMMEQRGYVHIFIIYKLNNDLDRHH